MLESEGVEEWIPGIIPHIEVSSHYTYMVVSQNRGTLLRVPTRRTIVHWGLYWGPLNLGNYHISR